MNPLSTLGLLLSRNAGEKILLNVHIASMHLANVLGGVGYLQAYFRLLYAN